MPFLEQLGTFGITLLNQLPRYFEPETVRRFGRFCGQLSSRFVYREYAVFEAQLEFVKKRCPSLAHLEPRKLFPSMFEHLAESVIETLYWTELLRQKDPNEKEIYPDYIAIEHEGRDCARRLARSGKPFLALSGHLGNFELLAAMHARAFECPTVIGREPNYSFLSKWLVDLRRGYGANVLMRPNEFSSSRGVARELVQAFKGKSVIAMLPDQDTNLEREFAPFFGLDASHPVTPIRLAVRNRLAVMSSFIVRVAPFRHRVVTEEILYDPESATPERDILTMYNARLEQLVREYPEQYLWIHRRWRRRPEMDTEGAPLRSTPEYVSWIRAQDPA